MSQEKKDGKLFVFGKDVLDDIRKGSQTVYDAVTLTYGPKGRNVILEKSYGRPVITRDGVTVARESYLEQRAPNQAAQMVIEASETTNRVAGDGTTQTVALTHHLIDLGLNKIAAGVNSMDVKKEIIEDSYKILANLESMKTDVKKGQLVQVASVSSGDENLGQLIAEAVEKVGADGGIVTEKAPIDGIERTYIEGYFIQQGFSAITSGKKELENTYVVVTNKLLSTRIDVMELLNKIGERAHQDQNLPLMSGGQPVPLRDPLRVAFFGDIEGDAYNIILANINQGVFDGTITKTPPMGDMGVQYLEDIALYTGGKAISKGEALSSVDGSYVGRAEKVTCTNVDTTIFGGEAIQEDLDALKATLKDRIKKEEIDAIAEKLKDRLAKIENKVAVFRIGGATDTEREELEFRIEDAIQASRAAAQHGIVTGGGMTLLNLAKTKGIGDLFRNALYNVFKKLVENAALPPDVKLNEALEAPEGFGFNLRESDDLVDLIKAGILDPYLVVEQVVTNAAATAANAVSAGAIITFIDKDEW